MRIRKSAALFIGAVLSLALVTACDEATDSEKRESSSTSASPTTTTSATSSAANVSTKAKRRAMRGVHPFMKGSLAMEPISIGIGMASLVNHSACE